MTPARKLALVVALQVFILFSVIGFREYAIRTGHTVVLRVASVDPSTLLRSRYPYVRYEISQIDTSKVSVDGNVDGDVYVEVQRADDGYWHAVAIHDDRRHTISGSVLIKGNATSPSRNGTVLYVHYDIESVFIPQARAPSLPSGSGHDVGVEVRVDRFGSPIAHRFLIDGTPFDLRHR